MSVCSSYNIGLDGGCSGVYNFVEIGKSFIGQESDDGFYGRKWENFYNLFNFLIHSVKEVLITDNIQNGCKRSYY